MIRLETGGEPARTASEPALAARLDDFARHLDEAAAFSKRLLETRCRHTTRMRDDVQETMRAFSPLLPAWHPEIVFRLYVDGPVRFNGLKRDLAPISPRVLTDKLRRLEADGVLTRTEGEGAVTYALTPHGERLARLLHPLVFYLRNREALESRPC